MEILCTVLLVILTHLVTCFPGIECGSEIMLKGVVAYSIFAPPYKTYNYCCYYHHPAYTACRGNTDNINI